MSADESRVPASDAPAPPRETTAVGQVWIDTRHKRFPARVRVVAFDPATNMVTLYCDRWIRDGRHRMRDTTLRQHYRLFIPRQRAPR